MKIHLATDHAGLELKNSIKDYLSNQGNEVTDHGAYEYDTLDVILILYFLVHVQ